jgi:hypothetical protein
MSRKRLNSNECIKINLTTLVFSDNIEQSTLTRPILLIFLSNYHWGLHWGDTKANSK